MIVHLYNAGHPDMPDLVAALERAGQPVVQLNSKYFRAARSDCDAAILYRCKNWREITNSYLEAGVRVFTIDYGAPELPGYPVATIPDGGIGSFTGWEFLQHAIPNAYHNPEAGRLMVSFYSMAPFVPKPNPEIKKRLPKVTEFFHARSLADAPRVWVVGGGPSLADFDWNLLEGEVVIGANRAYEEPNVGITITIDDKFQRIAQYGELGDAARERWNAFPGLKIFGACDDSNPLLDNIIVAPRSTSKTGPDIMPPTLDNMGWASNSGYAALKLAWAMGAKTIYCLGFDMAGKDGRQAWYHGGYMDVYTDGIYNKYREQMDGAIQHVERAGISVTVCGDTALKAYPTITLAEAAGLLSASHARPVVVGFFTKGTAYRQEAEAMARSATVFGLKTHLMEVENLGDWKANTDQKPAVIDKALALLNRPIAFVDADARFRAYPALFDEFCAGDYEIGLSYFNWEEFPNDARTGRELSSAVMLFKPTMRVFKLLSEWQAAVTTSGTTWEQRVLQDLLALRRFRQLKVMDIPMAYNQIFDHMKSLGLPVIEQMQASRRLKGEVAV